MEEIWKSVSGYEEYYVSNMGRVLSTKSGRRVLMKPYQKHHGSLRSNLSYLYVNFRKNGILKNFTVHKLVANTFLGSTPHGKCVIHKNGDNLDNRVSNLEFSDYSRWSRQARRMANHEKQGV